MSWSASQLVYLQLFCVSEEDLIQESSSHLSLFNFRLFSEVWPFHQSPLRLTDIIGLYTIVGDSLFLSVHNWFIPIVNIFHGSKKTQHIL